MHCPSWLWPLLCKRYLPSELTNPSMRSGLKFIGKRWPDLPTSESTPIFILSAGWRSGSTLLQRLVSSNPKVLIWGEPYDHALLFNQLSLPLGAFHAKWPLDRWFATSDTSNLTRSFIANYYPPMQELKKAHYAFMRALFESPAASLGRPIWGVKTVRQATISRYLKWLYPKAKFLYLIRNPYNAYKSLKKILGYSRVTLFLRWPDYIVSTAAAFAVLWRFCLESFLRDSEATGAIFISYEALLNDPAMFEKLQSYLNLELDRDVLNIRADFQHSSHEESKITLKERAIIRFVAGEFASLLGYHWKS